jgi:hypothetical protein
MLNSKFQLIDAEGLLKAYPKVAKKINEHSRKAAQGLQESMIKELGKNAEGIELPPIEDDVVDQISKSILSSNPRLLFDLFDEMGVYIAIYPDKDTENMWIYWNNKQNHSSAASSRIEAEQKAFIDAFKVAEELL